MRFSIQLQLKSIAKLIFAAFGKILVLANAFLLFNSNQKSIEKSIFAPFGKILGFGECVFSIQFQIKKVLQN